MYVRIYPMGRNRLGQIALAKDPAAPNGLNVQAAPGVLKNRGAAAALRR
jgi:hypothetical protein